MSPEEERNLIQNIIDGDRNAFEELVLAHQKNVYNLALKMTKSEEDALDISQETFFKAYRQLGRFRGDSKLSVWLYRMTYNLCIDFLRKQSRSKIFSMSKDDDNESDTSEFDVPDLRNLPEDNVIRTENREAILESVEELPKNQRQIFIMREVTGMSYADMSDILKISIGTVKSRLARARLNLANSLTQKGTFPENYRQIE